jgi:predicted permease
MMKGIVSDLRYALRVLNGNRGFAATAILTLALGIGANSAIFAVVHAVVFRDLPFGDAGRLVAVTRTTPQGEVESHCAADYLDIGRESRSFAALAAYRMDVFELADGAGDPERVSGAQVSAPFFDLFGVAPLAGRTFSARTDEPRGERLVVLAHELWQRRFAGDRSLLGRTIRIDRAPATVVGVMPPSFAFPGDAVAWLMAVDPVPTPPLDVEGDLLADREVHYFNAVARLKDGTSLDQAKSDLSAIGDRLGERYPRTNRGESFGAIPLREVITGDTRAGLFVLLAAVGFVLLIACANVAGLVLARAAGRRDELALRAALGAGRARLLRQLLVESLVIGLAGGLAGLLLASWGLDLVVSLVPEGFPRIHEVTLDRTVMLFALGLGAATSALFGILPALQASGPGIASALQAGGIRAGARGPSRTMSALVVIEVACGIVLTVGAGLMVNTLLRLQAVDPGYRAEGVVRVSLPLPASSYGNGERQGEFYTSVLEGLSANPITRQAAASFPLPLSGAGAQGAVHVEGRPWTEDRERPVVAITWVSPGYFDVLGIPLRVGRDLDGRDVPGSPAVTVISESAATRLWPGEDPIGRRLSFGSEKDPAWITVVGIAGDVRNRTLASPPSPMLYIPMRQGALPLMTLLVRSDAGPGPVASAVRSVVRRLDPELPVGEAGTFSSAVARSLGGQRLRATLLSGFAAAAILLAAIGVYGLLSYSVARRKREIGIRLALGATPGQVRGTVIVEGMKLALLGIALGVPAAIALSRLISAQLFAVGPTDPLTLGGVALLLGAVALAACWLPARRAAIDPVTALRAE